MNKLQKIILILLLALFIPGFIYAANLVVDFEQEPLFNEANFLPGGTVIRWVDVTNDASEAKTIGVKAKNYTFCSEDCLADRLKLEINSGGPNLYESSLADFFAAGEKKLSELGAADTIRYYFTVTFVTDAGDNYQSKQVGFDFDIGIFGQETIGGGGLTDGGGGGGGGSSFFGGDTGLIIFNEASAPVVSNQTDITWDTNKLATSRVIYSSEYEPHILDLNNPPNYGYARSTVEESTPVTTHSVNIAGLESGVTYYYRVVSRGSFAVSIEHSFTVPLVRGEETEAEAVLKEGGAGGVIALNQGVIGGEGRGGNGEIVENAGIGGENSPEASAGDAGNKENFVNPFLASLSDLVKLNNINFYSVLFIFLVIVAILLLMLPRRGRKK